MPVVTAVGEISYEQIRASRFCLAPSKYADKAKTAGVQYEALSTLIVEGTSKAIIGPALDYSYIEISDVDVNWGTVSSRCCKGHELPAERPVEVQKGDILISTVRTYRGGVGIIGSTPYPPVCSPALLVVRSANLPVNRAWLYAFLRSDSFLSQIESLQNRGMYPRLDAEAAKQVLVPIPPNGVLPYVDDLVSAYEVLRATLQQRHAAILDIISAEILGNQRPTTFTFELPSHADLVKAKRIDAGFFAESLRRALFLVENYRHGTSTLSQLGYAPTRGQNLQKSAIGESILTSEQRNGYYTLVRPTNLTEYGTVDAFEYLGNSRKLIRLSEADIVVSAEGNVGKCIVVDKELDGAITNIHGLVLKPQGGEASFTESAFLAAFLRYLRAQGVFAGLSVGGQGGSFAVQYWGLISIPNLPPERKKEIARLYVNQAFQSGHKGVVESSNFRKFIDSACSTAGIVDLDRLSVLVRRQIRALIGQASLNEPIDTTFGFLGKSGSA